MTTKTVPVDQSATNNAENPDVNKVQIMITPADKVDSYKPIKLQLSVHACFELITTTASISPTSSHVPSTTIPGVTTSIHVSSTSVGSTVVLSSPGTTTLIGK